MFLLQTRHAAALAALLLVATPNCASPSPPEVMAGTRTPTPERPETREEHCARMAAMPHAQEPPIKVAGDSAYLTPDGIEAGVPNPVQMNCNVSRKGRLSCQVPKSIPLVQGTAIQATLRTWRFQPATYDGEPIAQGVDISVPLLAPPPDWKPPELQTPMVVTIPFGADMIPPALLSGPAHPTFTRAALENCTEGKVIARCTITTEGKLVDCDIIKSVPHLDQAVLDTLSGQRYSPVLYRGQPQSVYYTLTFRFKLP
jgi:TonB family protein